MLLNDVRCKKCSKLLGKGFAHYFEIQCPRCKELNVLKAMSFNHECREQLMENNCEKRTEK